MHFAYLNLILQLKNEQLLFYFYFKLQISKIEVYNWARWQSWLSGLECKEIIMYPEFKPHLGPISTLLRNISMPVN